LTEYERTVALFQDLGVEFTSTDLLPLSECGVRGEEDRRFYGIPVGVDLEQKIDIGQTAMFFDHAGQFVGLGWDERQVWQPRKEDR
jgi:hypothetical protein